MKDAIREASAGAFAGAASKTVMAPLDRLKLVVQLRGSLSSSEAAAAYEGPIKALSKMVREEGALALWRGNASTVVIQGSTSALNFMFMDFFKKAARELINDDDGSDQSSDDWRVPFLSGGLAGGTAITLLYPIGLARTKLALDVGKETRMYPNGMRDVLRHSIRANGVTSLFQGYSVALASVSLYRMIHLGGYDWIKTQLYVKHGFPPNRTDSSALPFWERFTAAQFVSMAASTLHYPLDSVRRRLMMQSDKKERQYKNARHCFIQIYRDEGIPGYFRGLGTGYIRSVGAALLLVSYDLFKTMLS